MAKVTESDDVHDLDESDFIVGVARAIGASKDELRGHDDLARGERKAAASAVSLIAPVTAAIAQKATPRG